MKRGEQFAGLSDGDVDMDFDVDSTDYDDKDKAIDQKFFKFTIKGKDKTKPDPNDLVLDPCIICER